MNMKSFILKLLHAPRVLSTEIMEVVQSPSYYPERERKSAFRRFAELLLSRIRHEWNPHYNKFGLDLVGNPFGSANEYVSEYKLWDKIRQQNYPQKFNHSIILRDKCLFWLFMSAYGIPTPKVLAHSKHGHYYIGLQEVGFDKWVDAWKSFPKMLFLKDDTNCCGRGVYELSNQDGCLMCEGEPFPLNRKMFEKADFVLQAKIANHAELDKIYPLSVNTARLITVWDDCQNKPVFFTSFFRIGANGSVVDNWAVGGLAFLLSEEGELGEYGYFKDKAYANGGPLRVPRHPTTNYEFKGTRIPDYHRGLELALKAHALLPGVKSIGWDVAFTPDGPMLIEGNEDWEIAPAQMVVGGLAEKTQKFFGV